MAACARWATDPEDLVQLQEALHLVEMPELTVAEFQRIGGCFVCFPRGRPSGPGAAGEAGWAGASLVEAGRPAVTAVATGESGAAFERGVLALREGPLLERAVRALPRLPDVLIINATGRDHPRRAGLALHLGAVLSVPTIGITRRPLLARGESPVDTVGAASPLLLEGDPVGYLLRTRSGSAPLAIHAAWQMNAERALALARSLIRGVRTLEPISLARQAARTARSAASG